MNQLRLSAQMWADAKLCAMWPGGARWTVVVIDAVEGTEFQVRSVRLRWRGSAEEKARRSDERARQQERSLPDGFNLPRVEARPIRDTPVVRWPED